jgi:transposase
MPLSIPQQAIASSDARFRVACCGRPAPALLVAIEALYPAMRIIHVFLDNARYHHARAVQDWLAMPGRRIRLHFVPAYCPHLNPIERLWELMHKTVTHNRCYATYNGFCEAVLGFLRNDVPSKWHMLG